MQKMPSMPRARSNRAAASKLKRNEAAGGAGVLTLVLVIVSLVMFTLGVRENGSGFFSTLSDVTQTIVSPLRMAGAVVTAPFGGLSNVMRNLTADEKTLSELQEENARLSARNVELEEAELTAKRLQELLDLRSSYDLQSVAARVISGSTDSWTSTVTIDKGSAAGLAVGMPVVDENGAVGQIISCAHTTATVRLLGDEGSSISAMVQASRAQGMLRGSPDGTLYLSYIRTDQTVDVGDIVVTSGLGGVFPKGLPLGKVTSVESAPGASYYTIVVEPFSRADNLEELLVVTSLTEAQQASADDIDEADEADLAAASGNGVATADDADADETDGEGMGESDGSDASGSDGDSDDGTTGTTGTASSDGDTYGTTGPTYDGTAYGTDAGDAAYGGTTDGVYAYDGEDSSYGQQ